MVYVFCKRNQLIWLLCLIGYAVCLLSCETAVTLSPLGRILYLQLETSNFYVIPAKGGKPEIMLEAKDGYEPSRDISLSPNGQLKLEYDKGRNRFYVRHFNKRTYFKYWCLSMGEIDWSPDSNYLVYRGDADDSSWVGRIFIMEVNTGETMFLIDGDVPRWLP